LVNLIRKRTKLALSYLIKEEIIALFDLVKEEISSTRSGKGRTRGAVFSGNAKNQLHLIWYTGRKWGDLYEEGRPVYYATERK
jgi:hypothetical protein